MKNREIIEKAINNFVNDSYNCSEAIMAALNEAKGLDKNANIAFATAFGGGIGSTGHICGALTGGLMALGWLGKENKLIKPDIREKAGKLYNDFEIKFNSVDCSVLTSHNCMSSDEQYNIRNCSPFIEYVMNEILKIEN